MTHPTTHSEETDWQEFETQHNIFPNMCTSVLEAGYLLIGEGFGERDIRKILARVETFTHSNTMHTLPDDVQANLNANVDMLRGIINDYENPRYARFTR